MLKSKSIKNQNYLNKKYIDIKHTPKKRKNYFTMKI